MKTKIKHTPSPWTVHGGNIIQHNGIDIAKAWMGPQGELPTVANAQLIAAAPDLLESLKQTVEALSYWLPRYGDTEGAKSQMMINARAAIAKAEGSAE